MSNKSKQSDGDENSTVPTLSNRKIKKVFKNKNEMERAAKDAGLTTIDLSKFVGAGAVGEIIQKCNLLHVGLSMYAFSKSKLEQAMALTAQKMEESDSDETFVQLGALQRALTSTYNETATNIVKAVRNSKGDAGERPERPRALPPCTRFSAAIAVQTPGAPAPEQPKAID